MTEQEMMLSIEQQTLSYLKDKTPYLNLKAVLPWANISRYLYMKSIKTLKTSNNCLFPMIKIAVFFGCEYSLRGYTLPIKLVGKRLVWERGNGGKDMIHDIDGVQSMIKSLPHVMNIC